MNGAGSLGWIIFGVAGALIFQSRFYVQWIASELKRKSVVPIYFWYLSAIGSLMMLVFGIHTKSPGGALGNTFNIVIYARNLIHIWRERKTLTRFRRHVTHFGAAIIALIACYFSISVWVNEYHVTKEAPVDEARQVWFWLTVWAVGQGLFFLRFLVQWIATEKARKSVIPNVFWYISIAASILQLLSFAQRREWVFVLNMAAAMLIYLRNIWFIRKHKGEEEAGRLNGE